MRYVAGFVALTLLALGAASVQAEDISSKRIAVVNVMRVFDAYKKVSDIKTQLKAQGEPVQKELEGKSKELQDLRAKIAQAQENKPDSEEVLMMIQDFQVKEYRFKAAVKKTREDQEKVYMEKMKQVLIDMKAAIAQVGKEDKFDLILRAPEYDDFLSPAGKPNGGADDPNDTQPRSAMELVQRFRENPVLFFSQGVDVTERVISILNK